MRQEKRRAEGMAKGKTNTQARRGRRGGGGDEDRDLPALRKQHPIVSTSFEDALRSPALLVEPVRASSQERLDGLLSKLDRANAASRLVSAVRKDKRVTLVLSDEARRRMRAGDWKFAIDKKAGLPRADLRDAHGRIRETAKFKGEQLTTRAIRGAVALAHIVSAMDV